jgi:site-specific recombinase XerD
MDIVRQICYKLSSSMSAAGEQLSFMDLEVTVDRGAAPAPARSTANPSERVSDRAALAALEATVVEARAGGDERPSLVLLASYLADLGAVPPAPRADLPELHRARQDWLQRLASSCRSESALVAYRVAIDDLLAWAERTGSDVFAEASIVDYLAGYRERAHPAPSTYYRRFCLLRRFLRWVSRRSGVPDPFLDLEPPPKPRQDRDWLTPDEFQRLLDAAGRPERNLPGLVERDRLALLTLVTTGLRRSELVALDWRDLDLDLDEPTLLVRHGKGGKPRRQPLPRGLASELRRVRDGREASGGDPVFCGLAGRRLQETTLADIIRRATRRAALEKHVTAHTLRHTAATWLRQELGDVRLVAEYLGHADLSTVSRYAHVSRRELFTAAARLERTATTGVGGTTRSRPRRTAPVPSAP